MRLALTASFERYGVPLALLMDHGAPWWASRGAAGLTRLGVFLLQQGIRLIYSAVRHPQTQGKVERFHRTLGERLRWGGVPTTLAGFVQAFAAFRDEYNDVRPHAALDLAPPAAHFHPSARPYRPHPPAWDYPADVPVRRIAATGLLHWQGRGYFVSEALRGEDVACVPHDDRLLVQYRHMYVRELHLRTRTSVPLMQPLDRIVLPMS